MISSSLQPSFSSSTAAITTTTHFLPLLMITSPPPSARNSTPTTATTTVCEVIFLFTFHILSLQLSFRKYLESLPVFPTHSHSLFHYLLSGLFSVILSLSLLICAYSLPFPFPSSFDLVTPPFPADLSLSLLEDLALFAVVYHHLHHLYYHFSTHFSTFFILSALRTQVVGRCDTSRTHFLSILMIFCC